MMMNGQKFVFHYLSMNFERLLRAKFTVLLNILHRNKSQLIRHER